MRGGETIPYDEYELKKWQLARQFGWTLPEIEALSFGDLQDYDAWQVVQEAIHKAHDFLHSKK